MQLTTNDQSENICTLTEKSTVENRKIKQQKTHIKQLATEVTNHSVALNQVDLTISILEATLKTKQAKLEKLHKWVRDATSILVICRHEVKDLTDKLKKVETEARWTLHKAMETNNDHNHKCERDTPDSHQHPRFSSISLSEGPSFTTEATSSESLHTDAILGPVTLQKLIRQILTRTKSLPPACNKECEDKARKRLQLNIIRQLRSGQETNPMRWRHTSPKTIATPTILMIPNQKTCNHL